MDLKAEGIVIFLSAAIFAIVNIIDGGVFIGKFSDYEQLTGKSLYGMAAVLTTFGLLFLIYQLGYFVYMVFSNKKDDMFRGSWPLKVLVVLWCVFWAIRFSVGISGYVVRKQADDWIASKVNSTIENYGTVPYTTLTDNLQRSLSCCGSTGPDSWHALASKPSRSPPDSCCQSYSSKCSSAEGAHLLPLGCADVLQQWYRQNGAVFSGIIILAIIMEIVVVIVAAVFYLRKQ